MKFKKVLITGFGESELVPEVWKRINAVADKKVFLQADELPSKQHLSDVDCLFVKFNKTNREFLEKLPNLKYIGILATGYNQVDIEYVRSQSITATNVPAYSTESVAEFIIAALLEQLRQLEEGKVRGRKGNYSEEGIRAQEIKGKVFGVVGLGTIGKRVAEIAQGFGADVRYWSRSQKKVPFTYQDADQLIKESDFISVNLAQTPDDLGFFNPQRIQNFKKNAIVVNTAPMGLIDIDALSKRLQKGDLTFVLDHADEMPEVELKKLSAYKNCIIYPPMAYISDEAKQNKQEIFVSNIENFLKGTPSNVVS